MAENQTPATPTPAPSAPTEKVTIKMGQNGGGFSFDTFQQALGIPTDNVDERDEPEVEAGTGELLDDPETEPTKAPEAEDEEADSEEEDSDEPEESEEDEEADEEGDTKELEALGRDVKKGAIRAFTPDGKPLKLPPNIEIIQTIDGKDRRIKLRDHLNVVAGEISVEERIKKVGEFRDRIEQFRHEAETELTETREGLSTMLSYAKQGKPDLALAWMAERLGECPVELFQANVRRVLAEYKHLEGKSEAEIQLHYMRLKERHRELKQQRDRKKSEEKQKATSFVARVTEELKKEKITPDEFTAASSELIANKQLEGLSEDARLDRVIEHALYTKHVNMAQSAIELVDPNLVHNKKLNSLLLEHTHPNKFTVEEMADVVAEYLGKTKTRIASNLSRKVRVPQQVQTKSEKQNGAGKKQRAYRSQADMARAFGLS